MHHHYIDQFAQGDSAIHRLDARAKLLAVLAYSIVLISFGRYEVATLAPMAILPLAMLLLGGVPLWFALRRLAILCPFIAMLCLASPLWDRGEHHVAFADWTFAVSGGWLTAGDIAVKFSLGVLALTAMMCTTPFALLLEAMRKLGVPNLLTVQLGFLYRYIFVLIGEGLRLRRARDFRSAAHTGVQRRLAATGGIIGSLFVRTLERSDRIGVAMQARGFTGEPHSLVRLNFERDDAVFLAVVVIYLLSCRWGYWVLLHSNTVADRL